MKLAFKLFASVFLVVIILLAIDGYFSVQRELNLFDKDTRNDTYLLGHAMKDLVAEVWKSKGEAYALKLIDEANREEHQVNIRWVWLDALPEDPHGPKVSRVKLNPVESGEEASFKMRDREGAESLYTYVPVFVGSKRLGALELSENLSTRRGKHTWNTVLWKLVLLGLLVLSSGLVLILLGVRMVGQPLRLLIEKTRRVGLGDLSGPVHVRRRDELAELGEALNTMCTQLGDARERVHAETAARIAALEQLRHEDRLRTVGRLASGIAHELGTPLNVVSGRAGLIAAGNMLEQDVASSAKIIKTQSERMTEIIRKVLDFARMAPAKREPVDLRSIVHQVIELLTPLAKKHKAKLTLISKVSRVTVRVDPGQIQQVLTNLVVNAVQAMPDGGEVEVSIGRECVRPPEGHEGAEGEYAFVSVLDEGEGISDEDINHVFDPFFTTKSVGEGTGLGLSIAYGIVREHGGWISVSSKLGKGSRFSVYLAQEVDGCPEES